MTVLRQIEKYRRWFDQSQFKKTTVPKLLSLLFAIVFWIYVMDQVNPEMERTLTHVPVEITDQEAIDSRGFMLLTDPNIFVDVTVKGRRSEVLKVVPEDVRILADMSTIEEGKIKVELDRKVYRDGVTIDRLSQNEVVLQIDKVVQIEKPVVLKFTGSLPEGYTSDQLPVMQEKVGVIGPRSLVASVQRMEGLVNLNSIQNGTKTKVQLSPVSSDGEVVEGVDPLVTTLAVDLSVYQTVKVPVSVELKGSVAQGYAVTEQTVDLKEIELKLKNKVNVPEKLKTTVVDLGGLTSNKVATVKVIIPDELLKELGESFEVPDVKVTLKVEKIETKEVMIPIDQIDVVGVSAENEGRILPIEGGLRVLVTAVPSQLSGVSADTIKTKVDLSGLALGEHKVSVVTDLNITPTHIEIVPGKVTVNVTTK